MATLVVPGVNVEVRFDVLPPPPARAGVVGIAGIVDRVPEGQELITVTRTDLGLLGPGSRASMPEVFHALANGASEVVVSPVAGGTAARLSLRNADSDPAVTLRARSNGAWANQLSADVQGVTDAEGNLVRATIRLLRGREVLETWSDLQVNPAQPDYLFDVINDRSRLVVAVDPSFGDDLPVAGTYSFAGDGAPLDIPSDLEPPPAEPPTLFQILAAPGVDTNNLQVGIEVAGGRVNVRVFQRGLQEEFLNLTMNPDDDRFLPSVLLTQSQFIRVRLLNSLPAGQRLPQPTTAPLPFEGGVSPNVAAYTAAIDRLGDNAVIDLVLASIEPTRSNEEARQIHQALLAHAVTMSENGAPRIAFGSVTPNEQGDLNRIRDHAAALRSRRFVLVSPAGAAGAVVGLVARLNPQDSPTFKNVPLFDGVRPATYREGELNNLLSSAVNLLVVQNRAGRGVVVLRGIDLTGDQISVTRVADQAIREAKAISENFIGQLNTDDARTALREQIFATLTRMERAGALVPSTDGSDPAFLVDVYSTQQDFAQGIVRIDIAIRPVRAIDYIYATIRVKN